MSIPVIFQYQMSQNFKILIYIGLAFKILYDSGKQYNESVYTSPSLTTVKKTYVAQKFMAICFSSVHVALLYFYIFARHWSKQTSWLTDASCRC